MKELWESLFRLTENFGFKASSSNELCLFTFCIKHETCVEISAMLRLFQCEITFSYFCSATPIKLIRSVGDFFRQVWLQSGFIACPAKYSEFHLGAIHETTPVLSDIPLLDKERERGWGFKCIRLNRKLLYLNNNANSSFYKLCEPPRIPPRDFALKKECRLQTFP